MTLSPPPGSPRRRRALERRTAIAIDAPRDKHGVRCVERVCLICGDTFLARPNQLSKRKTCSRVCAAVLKRAHPSYARKGKANPNFKSGKRVGVRERAGEERWYVALGTSCMAPECPGEKGVLALHHISYRQHIRQAGGDIWDPRNALTLCASCHARHHHRSRVLPVSCLPDEALAFAADLFGAYAVDYLRRYYVGDDVRLDALLTRELAA